MAYSRKNDRARRNRLSEARKKGTHTKQEWDEMKIYFENTCCACLGESGLVNVEKEHIIALYIGGSDSIENIQPLCALCNIKKGGNNFDFRPQAAAALGKVLPSKYQFKEVFNG